MNQKRAQEIVKHIIDDKDHGLNMIKKLSLSDSIYVASDIMNLCIRKAKEDNCDSDVNYFTKVLSMFRPIVVDKLKNAERLWIVYCDSTGYPYEVDKDLFILFDYGNHKDVLQKFTNNGFKVSLLALNQEDFKNEISHMYRNGYQNIRFLDGKCEPFVVSREEFYTYDNFYKENYITNPGLSCSMISFFQEVRKTAEKQGRMELLKARESAMITQILNGEFMVPCEKTETEDEVDISHPFIDLSDRVQPEQEGKAVIAIPVFTDGFELDKCEVYTHETMLYKFSELLELIDELEADGIIINCLGISYYMKKDTMKSIL